MGRRAEGEEPGSAAGWSPATAERSATGPLRILYLQPCVRLGGAERQAANAISRLPGSGIEVVPVVGPTPLLCRWLEAQGVRGTILSRAFPALGRAGLGLGRWRRYLGSLHRLADQVEGIIRDGGIDLVVAGAPGAWLAASRAGRRAGVPVVWRADGSSPAVIPLTALRLWASLSPPDLLVFESEAARREGPVGTAPTLVAPAGVDLDLFGAVGAAPGRHRPAGAQAVIGFAGRLASPSRPEDFVRIAAEIASRRPGVAFLMAGEGPSRARCEALARALGVERNLRLCGFVPDMAGFYAACDVVIHPSFEPGAVTSLLEAMAAGRPVVAADAPANVEVLSPGAQGLVCPRGDQQAFADAATTLLDLPSVRRSVAHAARERVRRDYDARRCTARLGSLLREVVSQRARFQGAREISLVNSVA